MAARSRSRSASINARSDWTRSDSATERFARDTPQTAATTPSTTIATTLTTSSQTPIVVNTWLLLDVLVFDGGHRRDRDDLVVGCYTHHDHALRLTPDPRDRADLGSQHHAARADDQYLLLGIADHSHGGQLSHTIGDLEREHSLARPLVHRIFRHRRPLAITPLGDDEQITAWPPPGHARHRLPLAQLDAHHPPTLPAPP